MSEWVCSGWWNSGLWFPLRVSGFTGPTGRESFSNLPDDKTLLWHWISTPSPWRFWVGDLPGGPGICFCGCAAIVGWNTYNSITSRWLQQGLEPYPSTAADFSVGFCGSQRNPWKLLVTHLSPTPALLEGASVSAEWANDRTNSNMGKTSKPGSCEERKCFISLRFGLHVVAYFNNDKQNTLTHPVSIAFLLTWRTFS